jgi:integrase
MSTGQDFNRCTRWRATLCTYRYGLPVAELVDLRWDQIDFKAGTLHVRRVKRGTPSTHPVRA